MKKCSCDKWLTIAALVGWFGSLGSMVVLAMHTPSETRVGSVKPKEAIVQLKNDVKKTVRAQAKVEKTAKAVRTQASLPLTKH